MKYFIIVMNFALISFFTGSIIPHIGIVSTSVCLVIFFCSYKNSFGDKIIQTQLIEWPDMIDVNIEDEKQILLSAALLSIGMKVGTAVALVVEVGMIAAIAFAILIASGWIIEGRESGMTVSLAGWIAKVVVKVYNFLNSFYDKIAECIVKIEFKIFGIETK